MNDRPLPWAQKTRIDYCNGSLYCEALELRLPVGTPASRQEVLALLMVWMHQKPWQEAIEVELGRSGWRGVFATEVFATEARVDPSLRDIADTQLEAWAEEGCRNGKPAGAAIAEALDLCLPSSLVVRRWREARRLVTAEQICGLSAALRACGVEQAREAPVAEMLERAYVGELRRRDTAVMPSFLHQVPMDVSLPRVGQALRVSLADWLERPRQNAVLCLPGGEWPAEALHGWTCAIVPGHDLSGCRTPQWRAEQVVALAPPTTRAVSPLTTLRLGWDPLWGFEFGGPRLVASAALALEAAGFSALAQAVTSAGRALAATDWEAHYRLVEPYFLAIETAPAGSGAHA